MAVRLEKLNPEQREAVGHAEGPLLIVAGAGTGKTTVITQKIAYLIEKGLARPEEILAVTFTEKAAQEMEERVDKLLDYSYVDLWISTFHSFCERVLRDYSLDIGLPSDFKILDNTAGWLFVYRNLNKFNLNYYRPLGNPTKFIKALISHFSHCKDQEIYPEDYLEYAEKLKTRDDSPEDDETERLKEVAEAYHAYQRLLLENSFLDFGDLINYCLKLFEKRPLILKKYQEKFKYILVDEFQDTNFAQYNLIKLLAKSKNNLTVTADDDQAIYRWRGASFSNIIQFKKDFPEAKQVSLIKNYRSSQNILDLSYKFIKANDPDRLEFINKISKKLIANKKETGVIGHIFAKTLDQEVSKTIEKILELLKKDKTASLNDFAILVRANSYAAPFVRALERAGLPYQFLASKGLYSKPVILDIISYFKLLDNYHESSAVFRILNLPFLEISLEDIAKICEYAQRKTKSLYETMEELALVKGISQKSQGKISFLLSLIKRHVLLVKEKSPVEILSCFLTDSGYIKHLTSKDDKMSFDLLNQFLRRIKSFEETALEPTLNNFMREMSLEIESGEEGKLEFDPEQGPEMIKIMTIHGAKGLEFKYVFLANMVDRRFPTQERGEPIELPEELIKDIKPKGDVHLQEERRICYVAMTRAKQGLYFTSAKDYGGAREKKLSRFMIELGFKEFAQIRSLDRRLKIPEIDLNLKGFQKLKNQSENRLPNHFSYSQLEAFSKCPLQYKYSHILNIPIRGKGVFSFGKTMHEVLYEFLKQVNETNGRQNNLFGSAGNLRTKLPNANLALLIKIYEQKWIDDWYEDKKQKEEYYQLGKKIIKEIYEEFLKNPPQILRINNELALELDFNLKVGEYTLKGKIDRIDKENGKIKIIDYKTGTAKDAIDRDQLLIYQIAAEEVFNLNPSELIYHYINDNKKISFLGTEKDKINQKAKIIKEIQDIEKSDFSPTPGWQCGTCDFKDICESAEK